MLDDDIDLCRTRGTVQGTETSDFRLHVERKRLNEIYASSDFDT